MHPVQFNGGVNELSKEELQDLFIFKDKNTQDVIHIAPGFIFGHMTKG